MSEPVTADQIEKAAVAFFVAGKRFAHVEVGREPAILAKPGINVAVVQGGFKGTASATKLNVKHQLILALVVKGVAAESARRAILHPLVHYVVQRLWGATLNLDIAPFNAFDWREVTTAAQLREGLIAVEITTETESVLRKAEPEDLETELDEILGHLAQSSTAAVDGHVTLPENP